MQPGHILTKQYSVNDYILATSKRRDQFDIKGFVFVETDARVDDSKADVRGWAEEPLKEIAFLRRLVEGDISLGEGFQAEQSSLLRGIVAWAPLDRPLHDFLQYMAAAKEVAGKETWNKIKGFRYLVQGITDEEIRGYEERFAGRKKDLSVTWSLMAFSAGVIEAAIVVDRWLWLREQEEVAEAWVEAVFEYGVSPRNLVVVGVKR